MLVLTRKVGESIVIGNNAEINITLLATQRQPSPAWHQSP
jgi:carbon storage regulator CsrA